MPRCLFSLDSSKLALCAISSLPVNSCRSGRGSDVLTSMTKVSSPFEIWTKRSSASSASPRSRCLSRTLLISLQFPYCLLDTLIGRNHAVPVGRQTGLLGQQWDSRFRISCPNLLRRGTFRLIYAGFAGTGGRYFCCPTAVPCCPSRVDTRNFYCTLLVVTGPYCSAIHIEVLVGHRLLESHKLFAEGRDARREPPTAVEGDPCLYLLPHLVRGLDEYVLAVVELGVEVLDYVLPHETLESVVVLLTLHHRVVELEHAAAPAQVLVHRTAQLPPVGEPRRPAEGLAVPQHAGEYVEVHPEQLASVRLELLPEPRLGNAILHADRRDLERHEPAQEVGLF